MNTLWKISFGVLCGLFGAGLILLTLRQPGGESIQLRPPGTPAPIVVNVVGAVAQPGVYTLPAGSRVNDAIQAAGGLQFEANPDLVNLAAILEDGERIYIPDMGEKGNDPELSDSSPERSSGLDLASLININSASQSELESLPNIGPVTAQKIIEYRETNGVFKTIEALMNVPGIGEKTFDQIKDLVTTGF